MSNKEVVVSDVSREHENPIAELVQVPCQFDSNIVLENDNRKINAKSLLGVLSMGITSGTEISIVAEGPDEEAAVKELSAMLMKDIY